MRVVKVNHMVWGAISGAHTLFLLPTSASASFGRSGRCCRLPPCITTKLCKPFRNMGCKRNKWDCEEGGGGRRFQRNKVGAACLDGEVSWCGVNVIIFGVQEMERAGEWVAILLNDEWHSAGIDFGCEV